MGRESCSSVNMCYPSTKGKNDPKGGFEIGSSSLVTEVRTTSLDPDGRPISQVPWKNELIHSKNP